ncbi:phage head closure protein [Devosia sp.]|uniref:phage head closure protein n=1 Tax=Devosia sp. TaxID=1871048 RepID=UPI003A92E97B
MVGTLRDRVQLQRREATEDGAGGTQYLYVTVTALWARVSALSARQAAFGDGRGAVASHSVVMRHRSDVRPGDRFIYRGRRLEVLAAADLEGRGAWLVCPCSEREFLG